MAGKPGRSGTNKNKDKPWADALRIAAHEPDANGLKRLRKMAEACFDAAMAGDVSAMKEIGDRLDGKPAQESTVTFDDKRDSTDWTRAELVAFLRDAVNGGSGVVAPDGRGDGPDQLH